MTRRILNKSSGAPAGYFTADDLDYVNQLLTGTDQSASDAVDINTTFKVRHGKLRISNSGNTLNHIINGSATGADKTFTLPNLTGTGVTEDGAQTLTNKTMDYASNTFQNFPTYVTASGSDVLTNKTIAFADNTLTDVASTNTAQSITGAKTFDSSTIKVKAPATANAYTIVSSAITNPRSITLPLLTGDDTLVAEAHNQTLTNKTLTSPVISSISNTGTITLPTATTTLVGTGTSDTLTNKTMDYNSNTFQNFPTGSSGMPYPDTKRMGGWFGGVLTAGATISSGWLMGMFAGYTAATTTGTASYFSDSSGKYTRQTSGNVSGNDAGFNINTDATTNPIVAVTGQNNPRIKMKWRTSTNTACRAYVGFTGVTGLLTGDCGFSTGNAHACIIMPATGNFVFSHNDTSGPAVTNATGVARNSTPNVIEIKTTDGGTTWAWDINGTTGTETANVPSGTTALYPVIQIETSEAVAKTLDTWYWFVETDIG